MVNPPFLLPHAGYGAIREQGQRGRAVSALPLSLMYVMMCSSRCRVVCPHEHKAITSFPLLACSLSCLPGRKSSRVAVVLQPFHRSTRPCASPRYTAALPAGTTAQRVSIEGGDSDEGLAASSTQRCGHRFAFLLPSLREVSLLIRREHI